MKKFLASAVTAFLIAAGGVAITTTAANATPPVEECIPSEAWTETAVITPAIPAKPAVPAVPEVLEVSHFEYQRYSWTGGPTETAPTEVPPSANWQANTTNYEGAGHGTDPIGVAFPKNDNGKGDWFFWTKTKVVDQPYVPGTPEIPAVPEVPAVTQTIEHPAVTCEEEPVEVDPIVCVSAGGWYTEGDDLTPVATPEGLVFTGGSGKAVGTRLPVTGNLQGWTSASFDATGGTEQFFFRIVIDASADGGPAYKSLSFPGTSTITQDSVSYQYGETLAATAERFPNNKITSIGFQTNSGAPADFSATLRSFSSDCANVDFTYTEEEPPTFTPSCTTVNDSFVIEGDGVISVPGGWESESIAVPFSGTLADIGTVLNIDADPLQYVGLHIDTAEGSIVFEEEPSYNGELWSNSTWEGVEPGLGYAAFGTIEEYIHLNGDVAVTGIRLLYTHPEASTTTVESFTIGCTVYTFEPKVVVPPVDPPVDPPVVVPPTVQPPVETPKPVPATVVTADELAQTGAPTMAPFLWFAGSVIVAGAIAISVMAIAQRRRKANNTEQ